MLYDNFVSSLLDMILVFFPDLNDVILHRAKSLSLLSFSTFLRTIAPFFGRVLNIRCISEFYRGHQTDGNN